MYSFDYRKENWDWIEKNMLYNLRDDANFKTIGPRLATAKFLLLHTSGDKTTGQLFKITSAGPEVKSKEELIALGYKNPHQSYYFVYKFELVNDSAFVGQSWDLFKLAELAKPTDPQDPRVPTYPFIVTLTQLMLRLHQ